jgi:hypothetical protein
MVEANSGQQDLSSLPLLLTTCIMQSIKKVILYALAAFISGIFQLDASNL